MKTISSYLRSRPRLVPGQLFRDAVAERNKKALAVIRYGVQRLGHCPAISCILDEIIKESGAPFEGERRWSNNLTLLLAARALVEIEGYKITRIEHPKGYLIHSPRVKRRLRIAGTYKSCDIEAAKSAPVFFEVKDMSSEIKCRFPFSDEEVSKFCGISLSEASKFGIRQRPYSLEPASDEKIRAWLEKQIIEADKKGADYLIAHMPLWLSYAEDYETQWRNGEWLDELFPIQQRVSTRHYRVKFRVPLPTNLKGIYFVRQCGLILATS